MKILSSHISGKHVYSIIIQIIGSIATISLNIYLARILSAQDFGVFSFFISILALASILPMAGVPHILQANIPRLRSKPNDLMELIWWCNRRILKLSIFVVLIITFMRMLGLLGQLSEKAFVLLLPLIFLRAYQAQLASIKNSFFKHCEALLINNNLAPILLLFLTFIYYTFCKVEIDMIFFIYFIGYGIVVIYGIYSINETNIFGVSSQQNYNIKNFSFFVILQSVNLQLPIILINQFGSSEVVANYRVATMLSTIPSLMLTVLTVIYLPKFSKLFWEKRQNENLSALLRISAYLSVIFVPFYLFLFHCNDYLVLIIFGDEYILAGEMLRFSVFGSLISSIFVLYPGYLNMTGNEDFTTKMSLISIVCGGVSFVVFLNINLDLAGPIYYLTSSCVFYLFLVAKVMFNR